MVDPTGKQSGRGAYLHDEPSCWNKALKGSLSQALKTELSAAEREKLVAYAAGLSGGDDEREEGVLRKE